MQKVLITLLISILFSCYLTAQHGADDIIMEIGGQKITKGEFERIYKKNNQEERITKESLNEYLDLFINFKLKVIEAQNRGMDTTKAFVNELAGYRKQLVKPYLVDEKVVEQMMEEAYQRMKTEINASHILIKVAQYALPADTLKAYKKAKSLHKKLQKGEKIDELAEKYSEDPSAKNNKGNLGYRSALATIYPFENVMYNTPIGEFSKPFRTQHGYHIIKVHDRRPTREVKVAHIIIPLSESANEDKKQAVQDTMKVIAKALEEGADFGELAKKYSADKASAEKGGEMDWFGSNRMIDSFEEKVFALKSKGDITEPFATKIGWHIVKLIDSRGVKSYDEIKPELKGRISRDGRADIGRDRVIDRLKVSYNYKQIGTLSEFVDVLDISIFERKWDKTKATDIKGNLFELGNKTFAKQDFVNYLAKSGKTQPIPLKSFVEMKYHQYVNEKVIEYEDSKLEQKYPDFKYLMKEYHDGILLFELTDRLVWSKAVSDTTGLKSYYENHKNNYLWGERLQLVVFDYTDASIKKKLGKVLKKKFDNGVNKDKLEKMFTKNNQKLVVFDKEGYFLQGEDPFVDKVFEGIKNKTIKASKKVAFIEKDKKAVYIRKLLPPAPKKLNETRGLVTADYQNHLEKKWIEDLRKKYSYSVNKDVLYSIK